MHIDARYTKVCVGFFYYFTAQEGKLEKEKWK